MLRYQKVHTDPKKQHLSLQDRYTKTPVKLAQLILIYEMEKAALVLMYSENEIKDSTQSAADGKEPFNPVGDPFLESTQSKAIKRKEMQIKYLEFLLRQKGWVSPAEIAQLAKEQEEKKKHCTCASTSSVWQGPPGSKPRISRYALANSKCQWCKDKNIDRIIYDHFNPVGDPFIAANSPY